MKRLGELLLYKGQQLEKQNMLWNIAGSFLYAFASMVLSFLVMRIAGEDAGGVFAVGFSAVGQQMFTLAYFGLRPFQSTDGGPAHGGYPFGGYLAHRKLTTGAAFLTAAIFALWMVGSGAYGWEKGLAVFLLAAYKIIDGYADVYGSEFQRQGYLYLTGKSDAFRTLLSVTVFLTLLAGTRQLLPACVGALCAQIAGVVLFDLTALRVLPEVEHEYQKGSIKGIFSQSGLLFLSVFLDFYIFSAARYAIDSRLDDAASGYFNLLFMPTSAIYLVANFVIRPFLTRMTDCWNRRDLAGLKKILQKLGGIILGLTVLAVGGCLVLGRPVLRLMELLLGEGYEGSLTAYLPVFVLIVFGGGVYAFGNLLYYTLVVMRQQKAIFGVYVVTFIAALFLAPLLVTHFKLFGAAAAYCLFMAVQLAGFGGCTVLRFKIV
ncbi:MAG: lipopolysaccharide biosynthesis protein [Lachnospiraceae bacterium]|nr:lipopolysaccharide biosynthesis protein [Lachnospiraceae bacterium]